MFCSQCGTDNAPGAKFCAKCGNTLAVAGPPAPAAEPVATMRGFEAPPAAAQPVTHVGSAAAVGPTGKTPWVALLLSFFIAGLGQLYNGDIKKGLVIFAAAVLGVFFTGGIVTLAAWIWGMFDAWQVASGKGKVW